MNEATAVTPLKGPSARYGAGRIGYRHIVYLSLGTGKRNGAPATPVTLSTAYWAAGEGEFLNRKYRIEYV